MPPKTTRPAFATLFALLLSAPASGGSTVPVTDPSDCMAGPLAQFGRYIGDWKIEDSGRNQETGDWEAGAGAQWNFVCLGGMAVQDFWLPADGKVGTNLRTWNAETESWDIAWTITGMPGFAHIGAVMDDQGNLVMHYKSPLPEPARRITFFPPDDHGWNWKLEISQDEGNNWIEVYRIRATPAAAD
jgi:hypothetical protein